MQSTKCYCKAFFSLVSLVALWNSHPVVTTCPSRSVTGNPLTLNSCPGEKDEIYQQIHKLIETDLDDNCTSFFQPPANGTLQNSASSCNYIPEGSPSGNVYYYLQSNTSSVVSLQYCDTNRTCCGSTGGWMRVANDSYDRPKPAMSIGIKTCDFFQTLVW